MMADTLHYNNGKITNILSDKQRQIFCIRQIQRRTTKMQ